ncbi:MAG: long-chain fatty acid--CoA ligase [Bacillaceae bacterium]
MLNAPLVIPAMLERAEKLFPKKKVISRTQKEIQEITYKEIGERTRRLASALAKLGVKRGDKVGTFAWNHHRHLECYFAIPSIGAVLHTVNIRLSSEHISYILNHAEDVVLLVDVDLLQAIENIKEHLKNVRAIVVMTDETSLPETSLENIYHYEQLLAEGDPHYQFVKDIEEDEAAGMCFTSATTGNPKGVIYSHKAISLHSMALGLADTFAISEGDICMPVVPMFHVNAWGLPFACTWFGTTQVLPGPLFTPKILAELISTYRVTLAAGVPTIWMAFLKELEEQEYDITSLRGLICGGSAVPLGMIRAYEQKYHIPFIHAYGMTEASPVVTVSRLKSYDYELSDQEQLHVLATQGYTVPGVEFKVIGGNGDVKWDGKEMGELVLKSPWVVDSYYDLGELSTSSFSDGWFYTGDIVTIDEEGRIRIVDRTKDLIKSGGEWISSVDLENALMAHEGVFEAAVIAVPHEVWQERPLACVVLKDEAKGAITSEQLKQFIEPHFAKWWIPDEILIVDEIPKTTVGKFMKRALRDTYKNYFILS